MAEAVAVTGIGILCPLGIGREQVALALDQAQFAPGDAADAFDGAIYDGPPIAQVPAADLREWMETPKTYLDRCSALTLAACYLAVRDAHLPWQDIPPERRALSHATAFGCLDSLMAVTERMRQHGTRAASPMIFTHAFANSPASIAAMEYSVQGPAATFSTGSLAGADALAYGVQRVAGGDVDFCLAGGAEALSEPAYAAMAELGHLSEASIMAEGAAMLVLEPLSRAEGRAARPLALIRACCVAGDAEAALEAAGAEGLEPYRPSVDWGHAFGAQFPMMVAAAIIEAPPPELAGQRGSLAVLYEDPSGAACAVVEVVA